MPIYEYKCTRCGGEKTFSHGIEDTVTMCPDCKEETLERSFTTIIKIQHKSDVGKITKEAIEKSREELAEQKKKSNRKYK